MTQNSTSIARPGQARSQDTLRWGGLVAVGFSQTGPSQSQADTALANAKGKQGKQLVDAHWRWPLTWSVALILTPRGVSGAIPVQFAITVGSGDAQQTLLRTVTIPNGAVDSVIDNTLRLPACDLLIMPVGITVGDSNPIQGPGSIEIGAYVAPETEPHAMLEVLACLCRLEGEGSADQRHGDWMPPGFTPEKLSYGR